MTNTTKLSSTHYTIQHVEAINLSKSKQPISTGIGYLDHMIDQLNSHAQVGVSITVVSSSTTHKKDDNNGKNRFADPVEYQSELLSLVGMALGQEIGKLISSTASSSSSSSQEEAAAAPPPPARSRFCCPLDEALVECILTKPTTTIIQSEEKKNGDETSSSSSSSLLTKFELAPYGVFPSTTTGRTRIGQLRTNSIIHFFQSLSTHMGIEISLTKIRGRNAHHVVESAFKAFSRSLRNLLDGIDVSSSAFHNSIERVWGTTITTNMSQNNRMGSLSRSTKETSISIELKLDDHDHDDPVKVDTGIVTLDECLSVLARESGMGLNVKCEGDTWVDDHHTSEDVSIAVGKCLNVALGSKAGLNRMWCAVGEEGDAKVEVTMDLSNRPCLTHNLSLQNEFLDETESMSVEMFDHVMESLVMNGQMTVHIVEIQSCCGGEMKDLAMATCMAFGRALKMCSKVDPRRGGKTASSKGTLSV